jgi:hypothetical protein
MRDLLLVHETQTDQESLATVCDEGQAILTAVDQPLRVAGHIVDRDRVAICVKSVRPNEAIVTLDELALVRKKALFKIESGTMRPEELNCPAEFPLEESTMWPSSE